MKSTAPSLLVLAFVAACAPDDPPASDAADQSFAITDVTVIDVIDGAAEPRQTVVVTGDRITAVGAADGVAIPVGTTVIDGRGRFLIPGLWDMHVHMANDVSEPLPWDFHTPSAAESDQRDIYLPAYLAFGVTGVREMKGGQVSLDLRERVERGELLGPHTVIGSPLLDGAVGLWPENHQILIGGAEQARGVVTELDAQGFDFLKTYSFLSAEAYRALSERARELGIEVAGRVPTGVDIWEAAELGQRTVEHLMGVDLGCSRRGDELREGYIARIQALGAESSLEDRLEIFRRSEWEPLESLDTARCDDLFAHLAAHDTWVVPTLALLRMIADPDDPAVVDDPNVRYLLSDELDAQTMADEFDPEGRMRPVYEHRRTLIPQLHGAGVGILAGTDLSGGFRVHDELQIFVESGLSPLDALRTATINPARFLGREDDLGSIEAGKIADLVLLGANPLDDVGNTERIEAVVFQGHLLERSWLDRMLEQLEADADSVPG